MELARKAIDDRSGLGRAWEHKNEGCVALSLLTQTRENNWREQDSFARLTLKVPDGARILIVCDDDSDTETAEDHSPKSRVCLGICAKRHYGGL